MTPLQIEMLLKMYWSPVPPDVSSPVREEAIAQFLHHELVQPDAEISYVLTQRGRAYCIALQHMPLPVWFWRVTMSHDVEES